MKKQGRGREEMDLYIKKYSENFGLGLQRHKQKRFLELKIHSYELFLFFLSHLQPQTEMSSYASKSEASAWSLCFEIWRGKCSY